MWLAFGLALCPAAIAIALSAHLNPTVAIIAGLIPFGVAFAMNSAVHSYLILAYADNDKVAMNVGFSTWPTHADGSWERCCRD